MALRRVQLRQDAREAIQRTADDGHIVRVIEVANQGTLRRQLLKILSEVFPSAPAPFVVFHPAKAVFGDVISSIDKTNAASCFGGQADGVSREGLAMPVEVVEYDVGRLAKILPQASLGATLAQGGGEVMERSANVAQLSRCLLRREELVGVGLLAAAGAGP